MLQHRSVCVDLGWLLPEEVVDLVVGLRDHLRCSGSASFISSGGLLLRWGVNQGRQVSGSEVSQLHRNLSVLDDGVTQDPLVP